MTAIALATLAAAFYGTSDFCGGVLSRRHSAWSVAVVSLLGATVGSAALALTTRGHPTVGPFVWATIGGVGGAVAMAFIYRGLGRGRMGVVAPVSAVGTTVIAVLGGVVAGERPSVLAWVGIALAVPAIVLVSTQEPDGGTTYREPWAGVGDGLCASVGAGLMLVAFSRIPSSAGWWPAAWLQATSCVVVLVLAGLLGQRAVPDGVAIRWASAGAGALAALGGVLFLLSTQHGYLAVTGVIVSLYPAMTVLLAVLVLRERVHAVQVGGFALCATAVACIALS